MSSLTRSQKYYAAHRQKVLDRMATYHKEHPTVAKEAKARCIAERRKLKDIPCMDCGNRYPSVCMDFDHRPGESKRGLVSKMIFRKMFTEIMKCDVVCANCHRIRTAERTNPGNGKLRR